MQKCRLCLKVPISCQIFRVVYDRKGTRGDLRRGYCSKYFLEASFYSPSGSIFSPQKWRRVKVRCKVPARRIKNEGPHIVALRPHISRDISRHTCSRALKSYAQWRLQCAGRALILFTSIVRSPLARAAKKKFKKNVGAWQIVHI